MTESHDQAARHDPVYDDLAARPELAELRSRYRGFVIPATVAFLAWWWPPLESGGPQWGHGG